MAGTSSCRCDFARLTLRLWWCLFMKALEVRWTFDPLFKPRLLWEDCSAGTRTPVVFCWQGNAGGCVELSVCVCVLLSALSFFFVLMQVASSYYTPDSSILAVLNNVGVVRHVDMLEIWPIILSGRRYNRRAGVERNKMLWEYQAAAACRLSLSKWQDKWLSLLLLRGVVSVGYLFSILTLMLHYDGNTLATMETPGYTFLWNIMTYYQRVKFYVATLGSLRGGNAEDTVGRGCHVTAALTSRLSRFLRCVSPVSSSEGAAVCISIPLLHDVIQNFSEPDGEAGFCLRR